MKLVTDPRLEPWALSKKILLIKKIIDNIKHFKQGESKSRLRKFFVSC